MADTSAAPAQTEQHTPPPRVPGIASIKPEYVIRPLGDSRGPSRREKEEAAAASAGQDGAVQPASGADVSDKNDSKRSFDAAKATDGPNDHRDDNDDGDDDDAAEAAGLRGDGKGNKKARRGQNKARRILKQRDEVRMCNPFMIGKCGFGKECRFSHDLGAYVAAKERDLTFLPPPSASGSLRELTAEPKQAYLDKHYSASSPFVLSPSGHPADTREEHLLLGCIDTSVRCPVYDAAGECPSGWKCRYLGGHVRILPEGEAASSDATINPEAGSVPQRIGNVQLLGLPVHDTKASSNETGDDELRRGERNYITKTALRELKTRKYPLPKTKKVLDILNAEVEEAVQTNGKPKRAPPIVITDEDVEKDQHDLSPADLEDMMMNGIDPRSAHATQQDGDSIAVDKARVRPTEKKRLDWRGKLYLAPLTTTGNLPFRRLCASFGSDIHCGEMGLAESYLNGHGSEWSLIRRWEGERIFGTQICGNKPNLLVPAVEALVKEVGSGLDFVDLNCGCPIDLVYNRGAGSALLDHAGKLGKILRGVNAVLGEIPLTIKLRTGTTAKNTTHKLFARLQTEWGVSAATLHGRSRKQRYKNLADWDYIKECADTLRESVRTWNEESRYADEPEMVPVPIFGNGDVYSWEDYRDNMARTGVDGEMAARGALIKPWLFTEIKEQRTWDISSRERLDMYRQYAEYAISHWGSDTQGVNTARRYFCEALSFTHRYVPAGILEHLPPRLNDRPPVFRGRDELETLLASSNAADWVKISDMFFGKAPDTWHFIPKHKSSSYEDAGTEQQG